MLKKWLILVFISSFAVLLLASRPVGAQAGERVVAFDAKIQLLADGSAVITETINYDFAALEKRGIYRTIPTRYLLSAGGDQALEVEVIKVEDLEGNPLNYLVRESYNEVVIRIGEEDVYLTGRQDYVIVYRIFDLIKNYPQYDELYFDVVGSDFLVPIEEASSQVYLPADSELDLSADVDAECFTGPLYATSSDCEIFIATDQSLLFTASNQLGTSDQFSIVLSLPKGIIKSPPLLSVVSEPEDADLIINNQDTGLNTNTNYQIFHDLDGKLQEEAQVVVEKFGHQAQKEQLKVIAGNNYPLFFMLPEELWFQISSLALVFLPLILSLAVFYYLYRKGRDQGNERSIMPFFKVPGDLRPAELGVLYDDRADLDDLSATIIDLARRGYLKIKVIKTKKLVFFSDRDFELIKLEKETSSLKSYEQQLLESLFGADLKVSVSELKNKFYRKLPKIRKKLYNEVTAAKLFVKNPDLVRKHYSVIALVGIIFSVLTALISFLIFDSELITPWLNTLRFVFWLILVVSLILLALYMPAKTKKGTKIYYELLGLREYLQRAEKDYLQFTNAPEKNKETFSQFLPLAMVLGVVSEWSEAFSDLELKTSWLEGEVAGSQLVFTNILHDFSTTINQTFTSAPSSSSARTASGFSGFSSGGGFSGGGFGGGGLGSW
jgi:uncharacterized membrane protein